MEKRFWWFFCDESRCEIKIEKKRGERIDDIMIQNRWKEFLLSKNRWFCDAMNLTQFHRKLMKFVSNSSHFHRWRITFENDWGLLKMYSIFKKNYYRFGQILMNTPCEVKVEWAKWAALLAYLYEGNCKIFPNYVLRSNMNELYAPR